MTISKLPLLVSSHWLREQIVPSSQKLQSHLRVLDTSWVPSKDVDGYKDFYAEAHIPSSVYFDLNEITPKRDNAVKFNLPDSNVFQEYVEELGISNTTHIVAYDRLDTKPSFRTWFLFRLFGHDRVSVLNGGLYQWLSAGYPTTTEEPNVERGTFAPSFRPQLLRDYEHLVRNLQSKSEQVLDSRGYANYAGIDNDGGHIPNAINIPFGSLFNEDKTFKSPEDLAKLFKSAQVDMAKPIIASCMTGMTACSLVAAAFQLGKPDVPLYNGSFNEWSARADAKDIAVVAKKE